MNITFAISQIEVMRRSLKTMTRATQRGQVTIEYFILFAVIALLTVASISTFDDQVRQTFQSFFGSVAHAITNGS